MKAISAAGWGIGGSVELLGVQQWAAANCAAPPNASAGQYATSNCKRLLFKFLCKWRCIMSVPLIFTLESITSRVLIFDTAAGCVKEIELSP